MQICKQPMISGTAMINGTILLSEVGIIYNTILYNGDKIKIIGKAIFYKKAYNSRVRYFDSARLHLILFVEVDLCPTGLNKI